MRRPEQDLQRVCVQLLQIYESLGKLTFAHVPNGGKRGKVEAAIMKGLGVRAGFPDFIICWPGGMSGFIELKSSDGRLSEKQEEWRDQLMFFGHNWAVVRSVDGLIWALGKWGTI